MNIQKGNIIKIGKEKYDVLNVTEEIDKYDTEKNEFVGEHTAIELHKIGDSSLHPTHLLKIYHDNRKEAILLRIFIIGISISHCNFTYFPKLTNQDH